MAIISLSANSTGSVFIYSHTNAFIHLQLTQATRFASFIHSLMHHFPYPSGKWFGLGFAAATMGGPFYTRSGMPLIKVQDSLIQKLRVI